MFIQKNKNHFTVLLNWYHTVNLAWNLKITGNYFCNPFKTIVAINQSVIKVAIAMQYEIVKYCGICS